MKKKSNLLLIVLIFLILITIISVVVFVLNKKEGAILESKNEDFLLTQLDKQHCLSAEYVPSDLVNIAEYNIQPNQDFLLRKIAIQDLKEMIEQAKKEGIDLKIISAYRSYQKQEETYNYWVEQLGLTEANRQSAPAGCSQHQLGTAVDFNELDFAFANTPEGIWLQNNSTKYGWVISYPLNTESITGYVFEPWHYRYIGKDNAQKMQNSGLILSEFLDKNN